MHQQLTSPLQRAPKLWCLVAASLALLAYLLAAIAGDFFVLDDRAEILARPQIAEPSRLAMVDEWRAMIATPGASPLGRPVAIATFGANAFLAGEASATHFKITNVVLHALIAVLLFVWLRTLFGSERVYLAGFGALIWLLLPLSVSTVLYPVQRMAQLSALFTLLGLCLFSKWRADWVTRSAPYPELLRAFLLLLIVWITAVLSKETGILLPWFLVLLEVFVFRGVYACKRCVIVERGALVLAIVPVFLVFSGPLIAPELFAAYENRPFTLSQRLLSEARILWSYVAWIAFPVTGALSLFHDDTSTSLSLFSPLTTVAAIVAWSLTLAGVVLVTRRAPLLAFGVLFFLVGHSIESTVLPLELVFEHRNYLPSIGVVLCIVVAVDAAASRVARASGFVLLSAYSVVLLLLLLMRLWAWSDETRLYESSAQSNPDSVRSEFVYAMHRLERLRGEAVASERELSTLLQVRDSLQELRQRDALLACAGLYIVDANYFPGNPELDGWVSCVESAVPSMDNTPQNRNAVNRVLSLMIQTGLHQREGRSIANLLRLQVGDSVSTAIALEMLEAPGAASEGSGALSIHGCSAQSASPRMGLIALEACLQSRNFGDALAAARSVYASDHRHYLIEDLRRHLAP